MHVEVMDKSSCRVNCGTMNGHNGISKNDRQIRRDLWPADTALPVPGAGWKQRTAFCGHTNPGSDRDRNSIGPVARVDLSHVFGAGVGSFFRRSPFQRFRRGDGGRTRIVPTAREAHRLAAAKLLETDPRRLRASARHLGSSPVVLLCEAVLDGAGHATFQTRCPDFRMRNLFIKAGDLLDGRDGTCSGSRSRCLDDHSGRKHRGKINHRTVSSGLNATLVRVGDHLTIPRRTLSRLIGDFA